MYIVYSSYLFSDFSFRFSISTLTVGSKLRGLATRPNTFSLKIFNFSTPLGEHWVGGWRRSGVIGRRVKILTLMEWLTRTQTQLNPSNFLLLERHTLPANYQLTQFYSRVRYYDNYLYLTVELTRSMKGHRLSKPRISKKMRRCKSIKFLYKATTWSFRLLW